MVCILIISIIPVRVFHDLLADHTDTTINYNHTHENEVAKAGINCDDEGFVADKNYVFRISLFSIKSPEINCSFLGKPFQHFYSQHLFYASLRGPPSTI